MRKSALRTPIENGAEAAYPKRDLNITVSRPQDALEARPRILRDYLSKNGRSPFREWLDKYEHQKAWGVILARLKRVENGNFGDCRPVGEGVSELKIDFGPGYRVYFGQDGEEVILLCGGTKKSQAADITAANGYWRDYNA